MRKCFFEGCDRRAPAKITLPITNWLGRWKRIRVCWPCGFAILGSIGRETIQRRLPRSTQLLVNEMAQLSDKLKVAWPRQGE